MRNASGRPSSKSTCKILSSSIDGVNDNYEAMTTKGEYVVFKIGGDRLRWYIDDVLQTPLKMTKNGALLSTFKSYKMLADNLEEMEASLDAEVEG